MIKNPVSIVLAEEDKFLADIYKKKMELAGYKVTWVGNGEAALKEVEKKSPRLVILDVLLPKLDGFQVLETLKNASKTKHIPVIIFTHLGQKEDVVRALHLGAHDYILKPHTRPDDLIAKIEDILRK